QGGGVGAGGLGGPPRVVAELLGRADDLQLALGADSQAPVADVHAELHVQISFRRDGWIAACELVAYAGPHPPLACSARGGQSLCEIDPAAAAPQSSACASQSTACRWRRARRCSRACARASVSSRAHTWTQRAACARCWRRIGAARARTSSPLPSPGTG